MLLRKNSTHTTIDGYRIWDGDNFHPKDVYVDMPSPVLKELLRVQENKGLVETKQWCNHLLTNFIYSNYGFFIVDGESYPDLSNEERRHLTKYLATCIGKPLIHKSAHLKQDIICDVRDRGYRFTNNYNQNFHNSNQEAIEHTESTELKDPIKLFLLSVINPAYQGGHTRLVSIYALYQAIKQNFQHYLPELQKKYVFDTGRGERTEAPILSYEDNGALHFRWMRAFLENGQPLTRNWNSKTEIMLDDISNLMTGLRVKLLLKRGDIGVFNNRALLHARDHFEDHPDAPPRWLLRSWFQ